MKVKEMEEQVKKEYLDFKREKCTKMYNCLSDGQDDRVLEDCLYISIVQQVYAELQGMFYYLDNRLDNLFDNNDNVLITLADIWYHEDISGFYARQMDYVIDTCIEG